MKINIISDFVCPFCYIGASHLDQALEELDLTDVDIEYKSYQLDPDAKYVEGSDYWDDLANNKGVNVKELGTSKNSILEMAKNAGLTYNIDDFKNANTLDAHILFQYAKEQGKGNEYFDRLYRAVFTEGLVISDHDVLTSLADEVGLNKEEVKEVLADSEKYRYEVTSDILEARQIGVSSVPFFVINDKYGVVGAQPKEHFIEVIKQL